MASNKLVTSHVTQSVSITKASVSILYRDIITASSENCTKHMYDTMLRFYCYSKW